MRRSYSARVRLFDVAAAVCADFSMMTTFSHTCLLQRTESTSSEYGADDGYFADGKPFRNILVCRMAMRRNHSASVNLFAVAAEVCAKFSMMASFSLTCVHQRKEGASTEYWADVDYFADDKSFRNILLYRMAMR